MGTSQIRRGFTSLITLVFLITLFSTAALSAPPVPVTFTILHTNDFHGQLEASGSNPGAARTAFIINNAKSTLDADKVLVVDAGDEMQGSLLSNMQKGLPVIGTYNAIGYNVATFGNHEFDWGQTTLADRTTQATYPFVTANIVKNDTGNCATAGWAKPDFADAPYQIFTMGTAPNTVKVAIIGVTTTETPYITLASATSDLCFKDPAQSILHYYDEMKTAGADVIVVLSHLGLEDGGYGYGLPVYGDKTLARTLKSAGKPVNLILGGHSHTNLTAATVVEGTSIVQAYYNGRRVGRADLTVGTDGNVTIAWSSLTVSTTGDEDTNIKTIVTNYATDPAYLALINQPIGYSAVDLMRNYNGDNMMGAFIDDAIYNYLNSDGEPTNDVDMFFNNPGGIRTDWCDKEEPIGSGTYIWTSTAAECQATGLWTHEPMLLTYGQMFTILPFGNSTVVGSMTGAQVLELLNQSATLFKGAIQPSGIRFKQFSYTDANPGPQPYAWGAFEITVYNKTSHAWEPLDLKMNYKVGTNEFLAPAGGDGFIPFKYMTDITYWGDMLNAANSYVSAHFGTPETAYKGPNGDGNLDGRITFDGDGDTTFDEGEIIPLTILHHNDSHGYLAKGSNYPGYTQLATLIKQERAHNPSRTLLLSAGDNIQGDAMMYYFRTAPTGYASDGTPLAADLRYNPLIKAFNSMGYDAMTLGDHEFNFGSDVFKSVLGQATFPLLMANVNDTAAYGLIEANIQPYVAKTIGGIRVAIMGIGNHRVPYFELPGNIPGLAFSNPLTTAQYLSESLRSTNDVVIALTHIGFNDSTNGGEVDTNVDVNLAATVTGIDAVIGGHSHTNPASTSGSYKYLPSIIGGPDNRPVITSQAYRYNNSLGETVLGLRSKDGGYEVVSQSGRYQSVSLAGTVEDPAVKFIVDPYSALLAPYNDTVVGTTTTPIDSLLAYTQETNSANLQADAAVYELESVHGIPVDFHLAGAMTNKAIAITATPAAPVSLKVSDMFTAMPYENSLVVVSMNGPQIKAVLERAYRNYYYYKYVAGYGGYSYYSTCMLDTDSNTRIVYDDRHPTLPSGNNVVSLTVNGTPVNFNDASRYYNVSTVNYLAAGSCNFNNSGVSLWPLNQIAYDTQYYVRDSVIDYIKHSGTVSPAIEGRLTFGQYFMISGTLGINGAGGTVNYTGTVNGSATADSVTGNYSFWVPSSWSGTVAPSKTNTIFAPASRFYLSVIGDHSGQNYAVIPNITHITPSAGSAAGGTDVTLTGTGFSGTTTVTFGSAGTAPITLNSPTRITATSPAGTVGTTVHITVTTPVGTSTATAADLFTYANLAKNMDTGSLYTSLAPAITNALTGHEIRILGTLLDEDFSLNNSLTLYGGWDGTFESPGADPTVIHGDLTIEGGATGVISLSIKGQVEIHQGSLLANGLTVGPY
jgi:2',3'-cyclic-nucleotide 2'-phosphodiesterase (5'-nucleotidase family)